MAAYHYDSTSREFFWLPGPAPIDVLKRIDTHEELRQFTAYLMGSILHQSGDEGLARAVSIAYASCLDEERRGR